MSSQLPPFQPDPGRRAGARPKVVALFDPAGDEASGRRAARLWRAFVPIVDLDQGRTAGHELLVGFADGEPVAPVDWARRSDAGAPGEVEAHLVREALAGRSQLAAPGFLTITVSAAALGSAPLQAVLADAAGLEEVIVTVAGTPASEEETVALRTAMAVVRATGAAVAVQDDGSGLAGLDRLVCLRPDSIRLAPSLVHGLDRDAARAAAVEALTALAARAGFGVVAAGVTTQGELAALTGLGVALAQGPLTGFARDQPGEPPEWLAGAVADAGRSPALGSLADPAPPLEPGAQLAEIADALLADPEHDFLVVVDEHARPVTVVDRAGVLRAEPYERRVLAAPSSAALRDVARRAAARSPSERFTPVVCCDATGAYVGLVRIETLLAALAR